MRFVWFALDLLALFATVTAATNSSRSFVRSEALAAWSGRVGSPCRRAPADTVQPLFNDLHLYPSKTLVFEMMACARRFASRGEFSLSFGEFCVFAVELRRRARCRNLASKSKDSNASLPNSESSDQNFTAIKPANKSSINGKSSEPPPYEVFLGGSCNPTTWRSDVAIPTLDQMGITYYNPQVKNWTQDLIDIEHKAKESARVLFFVLDAETRAAAAAIEVAHLAASIQSRHLVLVLQPYRRGQQIAGESVPDQEYLDLSRGQAILQEVAERRELPVFNELQAALKCTQLLLRGGELSTSQSFPGNSPPAPAISNHIMKLKHAFDAADGRKAGSLTLNETISAIKSFSGINVTIETLEGIIVAHNATKSQASAFCRSSSSLHFNNHNETRTNLVDYETFCTLMAEISADSGCSDDFTVSPSNLSDLEKRIRALERTESSTLDRTEDVDEQKCQRHQICNETLSTATAPSQCSSEETGWREGTRKWRQLFNCVQAAILSFVSRIEINSTRFGTQNSNSQDQKFSKNGCNSLSKSSSGSSMTYARRKEQEGHFKSKYRESDENSYVEKQAESSSNSNGKQAARKLSVIIPKPLIDSGGLSGTSDGPGSAVLTPQSSRRLDGLAESVRGEGTMRDVYLGGSSAGKSNWREEVIVPILDKHKLSYYKPSMNDYNRMFSAPPYTPASGTMFTFDGLSNSKMGDHKFNVNIIRSDSLAHVMEDDSVNSSLDRKTDRESKVRTILSGDNAESGKASHKHERSPITGGHPEKKPKISRDESPTKMQDDEDIELRSKDVSANGYPLQASSSNRLSASDFYKISDNASPAPFRGMYDERQLWSSRVLFFGVTSDTRCLTPMVLASHCIGLRPRSVVLCVQLIKQTDGLSEQAIKDYNRGRMYLTDLAKREGVPVFDNLEEAIQCVVRKLENRDY